jgi:hypothetical protein
VGKQGVIHQGLIISGSGALNLRAEEFNYGVVQANGDLRFSRFTGYDWATVSDREVNFTIGLGGDFFSYWIICGLLAFHDDISRQPASGLPLSNEGLRLLLVTSMT